VANWHLFERRSGAWRAWEGADRARRRPHEEVAADADVLVVGAVSRALRPQWRRRARARVTMLLAER